MYSLAYALAFVALYSYSCFQKGAIAQGFHKSACLKTEEVDIDVSDIPLI